MTKLVTPKERTTEDGYGTSYIEGHQHVFKTTERTICSIKHQGTTIYCKLDPIDPYGSTDRNFGSSGKNVFLHENLAAAFPRDEIVYGRDFEVSTNARIDDVRACESATLHLRSSSKIDEETLRSWLVDNTYLLHNGITEVIQTGDDAVEFSVVATEPSREPTLKVTDSTEIEFVDRDQKKEIETERQERGKDETEGEMSVDVDVTPTTPSVSFEEDVAGLDEIKREAERIITLFDLDKREQIEELYGEEFTDRGNGMLLYGPPGCGKTLVSEAIANEVKEELADEYGDVKFVEMKGSQLLSRYPGESERRIEAVFDTARQMAEEGFLVLFFDEIETLIPDRGDDTLKRHERQLTNAFLQEMNDLVDDLLVLGATNFPNKIDPAADRRFPMKIFVPPPDEQVMKEVWKKSLPEGVEFDDEEFDELAEASLDYTPAEITDEVLGGDIQREVVLSVSEGDPISLNLSYLKGKLDENSPESVAKYVNSIHNQNLEGYQELKQYVEEQAQQYGISGGDEQQPMINASEIVVDDVRDRRQR